MLRTQVEKQYIKKKNVMMIFEFSWGWQGRNRKKGYRLLQLFDLEMEICNVFVQSLLIKHVIHVQLWMIQIGSSFYSVVGGLFLSALMY